MTLAIIYRMIAIEIWSFRIDEIINAWNRKQEINLYTYNLNIQHWHKVA